MILSGKELKHISELETDVCIIGGGPAAISMALSLSNTKHRVVLLTGGSWKQTHFTKDLNKGIIVPVGSHEPLELSRRRQFGGGSAVWAGRCVPFNEIDFIQRHWVEGSGWPIPYSEIANYYEKASGICGIGRPIFSGLSLGERSEIIPGFDDFNFNSNELERWSAPINFAVGYKHELEKAGNVRVLLDTHCLCLNMEDSENIKNVRARVGDKDIFINGKYFVLATGGIENARLLLASANGYFPKGIGNQNDNVGRYYMTHITGSYAKIDLKERGKVLFDFDKDTDGTFYRRRWSIPE